MTDVQISLLLDSLDEIEYYDLSRKANLAGHKMRRPFIRQFPVKKKKIKLSKEDMKIGEMLLGRKGHGKMKLASEKTVDISPGNIPNF